MIIFSLTLISCLFCINIGYSQRAGTTNLYAESAKTWDKKLQSTDAYTNEKAIADIQGIIKRLTNDTVWASLRDTATRVKAGEHDPRAYSDTPYETRELSQRPRYFRHINPNDPLALIRSLENQLASVEECRQKTFNSTLFTPAPDKYQEELCLLLADLWQRINDSGARIYLSRLLAQNMTPFIQEQEKHLTKLIHGKNSKQISKNALEITHILKKLENNSDYRYLSRVMHMLDGTKFEASYMHIQSLKEELNSK